MADNIAVTPGSGASIATDDVGGVHYPISKQAFGVADSATLVSAADPLPITVANASLAVTGAFYQATQPVSLAGTVTVTGGLTDAQIRATPLPISGTVNVGTVPVTGTFWQATQPVSLASTTITGSVAVTGTFWQATQPVSGTFYQATQPVSGTVTANAGTGTFAVSGPLTDTQLRLTAVPVSLASLPALVAGAAVIGAVTQSGTWNIGSITTLPALAAGANVIGALTANQSVNNAQINGITPLMGNGVTGTGSMRVTIASDNSAIATNATLQTGANVIGSLVANQSTNIAQMNGVAVTMGSGVTGTGVQRVVLATDVALPSGTNAIGTTMGPTLTKATQGSTGYSTQDLKDAGRVIVNAATAIAGVTAVTVEALLSLNISRDGAATAGATTIAVTTGKRYRVIGVVAGVISTGAAVISARVSLRMNPSGAVTATSPVMAIMPMSQQAAALAQAGNECVMMIPGGIEFSGTMQIGLTQVCSAATGTIWASIIGYEY